MRVAVQVYGALLRLLTCTLGEGSLQLREAQETPLVAHIMNDKPRMDSIMARTPMRRIAQPDEVSGASVAGCPTVSDTLSRG